MNYKEFASLHSISLHTCQFIEEWATKHDYGKTAHYKYDVSLIDGAGNVLPPVEYSIGEGILEHWALERGPRLPWSGEDRPRGPQDFKPGINLRSIWAQEYLAHPTVIGAYKPEAADLLECLALDASSVQNTRNFEDFARDFGYDIDSRKAESIYRACQEIALQLQRWLGLKQYAQLLECEE